MKMGCGDEAELARTNKTQGMAGPSALYHSLQLPIGKKRPILWLEERRDDHCNWLP